VTGEFKGQAFIGSSSGVSFIPFPEGFGRASAIAINDRDEVTGTAIRNTIYQERPFIGTTSGSITIPIPNEWWDYTVACDINNAGQVAGYGYFWEEGSPKYPHAFIGTVTNSVTIPMISGLKSMQPSFYSSINDAGQVIGTGIANRDGPNIMAWIYDPINGGRILNDLVPQGWSILEAAAINNKGQIVAKGKNLSTGWEGFVLLNPSNSCTEAIQQIQDL
jgi:hypothetical protein